MYVTLLTLDHSCPYGNSRAQMVIEFQAIALVCVLTYSTLFDREFTTRSLERKNSGFHLLKKLNLIDYALVQLVNIHYKPAYNSFNSYI